MSNSTSNRPNDNDVATRVYQDYVLRKEVLFSDLVANVVRIPIEKGKTVIGVRIQVLTAFAGGTPTVKVGDAASDLGFFTTTDVDITALNAFGNSVGLSTNVYAKGKFFASTGAILLTFAAGATAGKLAVGVIFDGYDTLHAHIKATE